MSVYIYTEVLKRMQLRYGNIIMKDPIWYFLFSNTSIVIELSGNGVVHVVNIISCYIRLELWD